MRDTLNVVKMRWWVVKEVGSMGKSNGGMRLSDQGLGLDPIEPLYVRLCIEFKCDTAGCVELPKVCCTSSTLRHCVDHEPRVSPFSFWGV